jgi:hypothetical protein
MAGLLESHLDVLRDRGLEVEVHPESGGWVFVVIRKYPLPDGYSKNHADLLLKVPPPYPNGSMDMFWVDDDLRLANGTLPSSTTIEHYLGRNWLRFSWHPQNWHPSRDSILTFIAFVERRLGMRN